MFSERIAPRRYQTGQGATADPAILMDERPLIIVGTSCLCQSLRKCVRSRARLDPIKGTSLTTPPRIPTAAKPGRRNPEQSRNQLITAALDTIAEIGIGDTTVTRIIDRAGLSRGMIHLHFGGKSQLLAAAAKSFSESYYQEVEHSVQAAGSDPEAIILSVVRADLGDTLMNERTTRIWHAFRGAAGTDPGIASYSNTRDKRLREILHSGFSEIAKSYDDARAPDLTKTATYGLLAMLEGMWVDYLANSNSFSRREAIAIVCRLMSGLFPRHFLDQGKK